MARKRYKPEEIVGNQRWSLKSGQVVKLFPSMRRTGFGWQDQT